MAGAPNYVCETKLSAFLHAKVGLILIYLTGSICFAIVFDNVVADIDYMRNQAKSSPVISSSQGLARS